MHLSLILNFSFFSFGTLPIFATMFIHTSSFSPTSKVTEMKNVYDPEMKVPNRLHQPHSAMTPNKLIFLSDLEYDIYSVLLEVNKSQSYQLRTNKTLAALIRSYLHDYQNATFFISEENGVPFNRTRWVDEIASNPLMTYRMIRRYVVPIDFMVSYLNSTTLSCQWCRKLKNLLIGKTEILPSLVDLKHSMDSILKIQLFYNYNPNDISNGKLGSLSTPGRLTELNMIEIGNYAREIFHFVLAIEWMELGLPFMKKKQYSEYRKNAYQYIKQTEGYSEYLKETKIEHDAWWDAYLFHEGYDFNFFAWKFFNEPEKRILDKAKPKRRPINIEKALKRLREDIDSFKGDDTDTIVDGPHANGPIPYMSLCSGENYQSAEEKRKLHCWYETKSHPYWKINPLKMELLHAEPRLVQVYDLFGDTFLDEIYQESAPKLEDLVFASDKVEMTAVINNYRTATIGWLENRSTTNMESYYQKINFLTGLNVREISDSETLQMAGYSFGGNCALHSDCLLSNNDQTYENSKGDRFATVITYMNTVKAGGFTAFPYLGIAAIPVKGSAIFWYDTFKNGTCDPRVIHGACPVILGYKYVLNFWPTTTGNFLEKCDLDRYK